MAAACLSYHAWVYEGHHAAVRLLEIPSQCLASYVERNLAHAVAILQPAPGVKS